MQILLMIIMLFIMLLGLAELMSTKNELVAIRKLLEKQKNNN
ncbi:hypothetical protein [Bacillus sp. 1P06AnD]